MLINPLQRALIEKVGHGHGFEHVLASDSGVLTLASARHPVYAIVRVLPPGGFSVVMQTTTPALMPELQRSFSSVAKGAEGFVAASEAELAALLRRTASLARALPNQAVHNYQVAVADELAQLSADLAGTEVERLVRQRVGQAKFREAMLDYWGGACAVTGVGLPEALRASHAKPWAECASDGERLDVFNGFLLTANLDALFDRFLISFDDAGRLLPSSHLSHDVLRLLGVFPGTTLRWISDHHRRYLAFHRARFNQHT